jgi:hypothetical protein
MEGGIPIGSDRRLQQDYRARHNRRVQKLSAILHGRNK